MRTTQRQCIEQSTCCIDVVRDLQVRQQTSEAIQICEK